MAADQLVGAEIHGFHTLQELDFENIMHTHAGRRWLGPHEIHAILCNYKRLNHLISVSISPVHLPKSGTILLFDRKIHRNFRKDGHDWKKRKNGKGVNESHERIKVGNEERIHAYYVRRQDNTFARRCYQLLDKKLEHIFLVHYCEVQEESGANHVDYADDKDFLESTGPGDNLTVQNYKGTRNEINSIQLNCPENCTTSPKRKQEGLKAPPEGSGSGAKRGRLSTFSKEDTEVVKIKNFLEPILEPLILNMVKEEIEIFQIKHLDSMKQNCGNEVHTSESRSLQLKFINNLSLPVFTGAPIEGEDCSKIQVALVDAHTAQPVTSGPESSCKVEIVVLEGDFEGDEHDNWTAEVFKNNIVREREGKKPLLTGDAFVNLKDGTGVVGEISFSDNSSWTRSHRFRLGVRFVDNIEGIRVREAKTESFIVDHCEELYKKHHPPSLFDEVWRLEYIGKDGDFHQRLSQENINTVKDFLTLLFIDPPRLIKIFGTSESAEMWEVTVEHARTCVLDKRVFLYCPPGSQQKNGVVFNIVGQLRGLLSGCQYVPLDKLSETEKADAQNLVISAFQHWEEVISYDEEASLTNANKKFLPPDIGEFDHNQQRSPSPDIFPLIFRQLDDFNLPSFECKLASFVCKEERMVLSCNGHCLAMAKEGALCKEMRRLIGGVRAISLKGWNCFRRSNGWKATLEKEESEAREM